MAKIPFRERLQQGPILADGAMGTMLNQSGINLDASFDALNITAPAVVAKIHTAYIQAGAEIIETNTFSANPFKLRDFQQEQNTIEINEAGVELARRVVDASFREDVYIAGSVGPLGVYLEPFGRVRKEQAYAAFRKQIGALIHSGADLILFETFTDLPELELAIQVARDIRADIPIVASMTFTRDNVTLMGDTPVHVAKTLAETSADVIGVNCSSGPVHLRRILHQMKQAVPDQHFSVMPNAGWPEMIAGRVMYAATPDYMADYALTFIEEGATVVGGCCGTTPDHIREMRRAIDNPQRESNILVMTPDENGTEVMDAPEKPTELQRKLVEGKFVVTVEMAPPRGFVMQKVVAAADMLRQAGVDTINVSDSPMARMRMSPWAVAHLIQDRVNIETVLHFPTRGRNMLRVQGDLLAAHGLDVRNIFVVMGDPTHIGDYPDAFDSHDVVPSGLIYLIKQKFNAGIDQAGNSISQPTSFFVGTALNLNAPDLDKEVKLLHKKIEAGADFALTQPIFDPALAERFIKRYEEVYEPLPLPILVGLLPLYNERHAAFLHNEVPGIHIPEAIRQRMINADDTAMTGVKVAQELLLDLKDMVQGTYLMPPFAKYHLAAEVVDVLAVPVG